MKRRIFKLSADTNTIVSISAIILSLASIFIATWQGVETRRHNRLSVRPKLAISFEVNKNAFGYAITNKGLGPANIIEHKIFLDGKEFIPPKPYFGLHEALEDTLHLIKRTVAFSALGSGTTIEARERQSIIYFSILENDSLKIEPTEIYQRLAFKISYESMYGESFTYQFPK